MRSSLWWLIGIGVLIVVVIGWQRFGTATISVTSDPPDGLVWIDGRRIGQSPVRNEPVATGKHLILVEHSYFAPYEQQVSVAVGNHLEHHAVMRTGKGALVLVSNPRGAWVEVNGERLPNVTPTRLDFESGVHQIVMGLPERKPFTKEVTLNDGATLEVNQDLNVDPHGSLTIVGAPAGARVEILDSDIQYRAGVRLPVGEYVIRVSRDGFSAVEERLMISGGENTHRVGLDRRYGELRVNVVPEDAQVFVSAAGGRSQRYGGPTKMPTGAIEVRARALGHRTTVRHLRLEESGTTVTLQLEAMRVQVGGRIRDVLKSGGTAPEMVIVPAGQFRMGSANGTGIERPVHEVTMLLPFAVSVLEVQVSDYLKFVEASSRKLDRRVEIGRLDHPIAYVTWDDALAYSRWLSRETGAVYRLLSEAEWEYVARAGTSTPHYFGADVEQLCAHGNVADQSVRAVYREWTVLGCTDGQVKPGPVGRYKANSFGLQDVYGNVSEWVLDCDTPDYGAGAMVADDLTADESCESHGHRGGSWDSGAENANSSYRVSASTASEDRGIRLARDL